MKGVRTINCARCNGQSVFLSSSGKWDLCGVCGGSGKVHVPDDCLVCPVCKGAGTRACADDICNRCGGVGRIAKTSPDLR